MTIGEKIKYFRTQKEMTQEKLASELFVSYQAVSKWERNETLPDITVLSKLAKILEVSCDAILTDNIALKQREIEKIIDKATKEKIENRIQIYEKAIEKFPNNEGIIMELIVSYSMANDSDNWNGYRQNIISYAEYIVANTKNAQYRYKAIQILCYIYRETKNFDRIKTLAEEMPTIEQCKEALVYHSLQGVEYKNGMLDYAIKLTDTLETILSVILYPNSTEKLESLMCEIRALTKDYKI